MLRNFLTAGVLVLACTSVAFPMDPSDIKPIAELELMTQRELAWEAERACHKLVALNQIRSRFSATAMASQASNQYRAEDYMQTVGRVARKLNGGTMPLWVGEMDSASRTSDALACYAASKKAED
jgi:hypothetical protein